MNLPTREHFDLDGAAEFLGCSLSDVLYYVKQDQLRLAFNSEHAGQTSQNHPCLLEKTSQ
jgi:hypothetical protein